MSGVLVIGQQLGACNAFSGPGWFAIIDLAANSELFKPILLENIKLSISELMLNTKWIM